MPISVHEFVERINNYRYDATSWHKVPQNVQVNIGDNFYDIKDIEINTLFGCQCGAGLILVCEESQDAKD
jgi:hypothetical protein